MALDDAAKQARRNLGGGGALTASVHAESESHLRGRIGSNHDGARAQELGAWIVPKRRRALKFHDGSFRMHGRLKAKHYLLRAAVGWKRQILPRLRQAVRA